MSTETRTFWQIEKCLKIIEKLEEEEYFKFYKTYDIIFCQMIREKYYSEIIVNENIKDSLKKFELDKHNISKFIYKDDKFKYVNNNGEELDLTSLSAGEQSLINMLLANY